MDPRGERFEHERADAGRRLVLTINGANAQVDARRFICRVHHACVLVARFAEERKLEIDTSRPTLHSPPCAGFLKRYDMGAYESFISAKRHSSSDHGFDPVFIPDCAFDFQREIISRAVRKGRVGVFADTGLGKTLIELSIAENVPRTTGKQNARWPSTSPPTPGSVC